MINTYRDNCPCSEQGFGLPLTHYVSGRVSAAVAGHGGLCGLRYYGRQPHGKSLMLQASEVAAFSKLGRVQALIDGQAYYLEFTNTRHYPFGYESECRLADVKLRHELILDQDTVFQRLTVLENPQGRDVRARLLLHGHLWQQAPGRSVGHWEIIPETGTLTTRVVDQNEDGSSVETTLVIGANAPCAASSRHGNFKHYVETTSASDEIIFHIAFNPEAESDFGGARLDAVKANFARMLETGLRFETGNPTLDSALNNVAPTVANLVIQDCPGAIRASQSYWVWGWDSMVHAEALIWSGQADLVRDMLDFYHESADPKLGVAHALYSDLTLSHSMAFSAQCLYVVMLYNYVAATGDRAPLERHLDFARMILDKAGEAIAPGCNLSTGIGFYPDFPQLLEHQPHDLSLINNSLYYQALAAMSELEDAPAALLEKTGKVKADMERILWDDEAGYWIDSASGDDLAPRRYYPLFGQLYVSPFGTDPHAESDERIAQFMRKKFPFPNGLYMYPQDNAAFMADGNQLGAYYPSVDRYYWNMMNRTGCAEVTAHFEQIVTGFWKEHSYPEGLTHETVNDDPATDNPGCKQAFAAKGWCCDALELHLGLKVDLQGLTFNPLPDSRPFRVRNLTFRGKKLDVERVNGRMAEETPNAQVSDKVRYTLNGKPLSTPRVRWNMLKDANILRIELV
jgi:hypothetical protein